MTVDAALRGIAGAFLLLSLALAHYVSPNWLWFTAFIGANLLQSAFSGWCPMMAILRRVGLKDARGCC
ncbi:MAG: DUF2892 domain-containing protein [Nitrospirae bacterium]|nr:DUF2892 domain-containing protein [Nitrospirota bacterium]